MKTPSGVLSTAEAISVLAGSMALAANFGTGQVSDDDLASGIQGAIIKDEEKDKGIWQEYLSNVLKKTRSGMAAAIQCMFGAIRVSDSQQPSSPWRIHVFGVRHLSPSGAWHLRRYLDRVQPELVLVEGLADATELTRHLVKKGTKPPIAILAYTSSLPVRTLVYPLAKYSPEFQAVFWAHENRVPLEFIDLPSEIFLALQDREFERAAAKLANPMGEENEHAEVCRQ